MDKIRRVLQQPNVLLGLLVIASLMLAIGMVLPVMTIKTLVFMRNSFSILSGIYDLLVGGKYFLFIVVVVFSVVLPIVKLVVLFVALLQHRTEKKPAKLLAILHDYGRWAMLDVFVVALLVVSIKLGAMASVIIHVGFYIFATAVLLTMFLTHLTMNIQYDPPTD